MSALWHICPWALRFSYERRGEEGASEGTEERTPVHHQPSSGRVV
jgi:hypothetical protein